MEMSEGQQLGRAKNALLDFFENRITVPKIYLDATWDGQLLDVLAIDREGAGDVHAVLIFLRKYSTEGHLNDAEDSEKTFELVDRLAAIPANFKYVAAVDIERNPATDGYLPGMSLSFFPPDGIGRVGLLHINLLADGPTIDIRLRPERFRAKIAKLANEYIANNTPDWELRA